MISSFQITNTAVFTFKAVLVFKLLSRKILFINRTACSFYTAKLYCLEETTEFDVKVSFASCPVSRLHILCVQL